jgi:hypothetical protein
MPPLVSVAQGEAVPLARAGLALEQALATALTEVLGVALALPLSLPAPPPPPPLALRTPLTVLLPLLDAEDCREALGAPVGVRAEVELAVRRVEAVPAPPCPPAALALPLSVPPRPTTVELAAAQAVAVAVKELVTEGEEEGVLPLARDGEAAVLVLREGRREGVSPALLLPPPPSTPTRLLLGEAEREELAEEDPEALGERDPPGTAATPPSALGVTVVVRVERPSAAPSNDTVASALLLPLAVPLAPSSRDCVGEGVPLPVLALLTLCVLEDVA